MIKPRPWQESPLRTAVECISSGKNFLDLSDTGTGKTYVALLAAKELGMPVFVVCPKSVVPSWEEAAAKIGVDARVWTYQKVIARGRRKLDTTPGKWRIMPSKKGGTWEWNDNASSRLLIFDEAHYLAGSSSQTSKLAIAVRRQGIPSIFLSATLADSPLKLKAVGHAVGLHTLHDDGPSGYINWCARHGCYKPPFGGMEFNGDRIHLRRIRETLSDNGQLVRVKTTEIPNFPENFVSTVNLPVSGDPEAIYKEMEDYLADNPSLAPDLEIMMAARRRSEALKAPAILDMVRDLLAEGNRVTVFVTFRETLEFLSEKLSPKTDHALIYGGQTTPVRQDHIEKFVGGKCDVLLSMIQAGGTGLNLHDQHGHGQVVSLICPTWNPVELRQCLGRIHRDGSATPAIQRILFCEGSSVEARIKSAVDSKLKNLDALNDGDLSPMQPPTPPIVD